MSRKLSSASSNSRCQSHFHRAVASGSPRIAQTFLLHEPTSLNDWDPLGNTPLHLATQRRDLNMVRHLLEHGADPNRKTRKHPFQTPLFLAVACLETAQLLLQHGADVNCLDPEGRTPLHLAADLDNNVHVVKLLLDYGAKVNEPDRSEFLPMHYALARKQLDVAKLLLENGTCLQSVTRNRDSFLHWAVKKGNKVAIKFLLENEADVNAIAADKKTPLGVDGCSGEVRCMLMIHVVKLRCLDLYVSRENGECFERGKTERLVEFEERCRVEVGRMKEEKVGEISLYDVLKKDREVLVDMLGEDMGVVSRDFILEYPIYCSMLYYRIKKLRLSM